MRPQARVLSSNQLWFLTALTDAGVPCEEYHGFRVLYPSSTASIVPDYANQPAAHTGR